MPRTLVNATLLFCISCCPVLSGCRPHADGINENGLCRDFFLKMSRDERLREFKKCSLDEQYDLFIWGNQVVHPPATYLAEWFAQEGPKVVPFLGEKLKATTSETTVRDIALVLSELARSGAYDFSKNPELVHLLDQRADAMQGQWKDVTHRFISEIRLGPEKDRKRGL